MYLGRVVEAGPTEDVLRDPQHPYTQALLSVVPEIDHVEPVVLTGEVPDPTRIPRGCRFHPRCPALADGSAAARRAWTTPAGGPRWTSCPRATGTTRRATWWPSTASSGEQPAGGAAAGDVRRRRRRGRVERDRVLFATWACVGPARRPRPGEPGRIAVVDVVGGVGGRDARRRRPARGVQRLPAPRLAAGARVSPGPSRSARRPVRCAARTTRGPTRWPAGCSRRRTPTASTSTRPTSRCTRSASRSGRGSCSCT